ncbi:MAG TPA: hypothetical protein VK858_07450 [Longimicrobiales bacterium]|nr:hypothetical protein [Longimicrobiales bacterium]
MPLHRVHRSGALLGAALALPAGAPLAARTSGGDGASDRPTIVFSAGDAYGYLDDEELAERPDFEAINGFDPGRAALGGGVELGWASPVGPVVLALGAADEGSLRLGLRAGYVF